MTNEIHCCPICAVPFQPGDICADDIELGTCHAACLEGSPVVDLETGHELLGGQMDTYSYGDFLPATPAPETHVVAEQAGIAVLDCTRVGRTEREQEQNSSPKMNLPGVVAAQVPPATLSPCDAPRIVDEIDQRVSAHEHDVREEQLPEGFPGHNLPVPEAQDQYDGEGDGRSNAYGTKYGDDPCNHDGSPTLGSHTGIGIAVEPRLELALTATAPHPSSRTAASSSEKQIKQPGHQNSCDCKLYYKPELSRRTYADQQVGDNVRQEIHIAYPLADPHASDTAEKGDQKQEETSRRQPNAAGDDEIKALAIKAFNEAIDADGYETSYEIIEKAIRAALATTEGWDNA
jgi:hypothetical protein